MILPKNTENASVERYGRAEVCQACRRRILAPSSTEEERQPILNLNWKKEFTTGLLVPGRARDVRELSPRWRAIAEVALELLQLQLHLDMRDESRTADRSGRRNRRTVDFHR